MLVKILVMSADPYLRGQIKSTGSLKKGQVMEGFVGGKVIASCNDKWLEGDLFGAKLPFTSIQVLSNEAMSNTVMWKLTGLIAEKDISRAIGVLGMPGSTAYGGLVDVLRPNEGETIFISAASGAVGGLVGMIAKSVYNCTVIGSCGGPEKCRIVKEKYGFDHAIDYKKASNKEELAALLKEVAPDGIDMYFENVGGIHFEVAFEALRTGGRIAVCGQIASYNTAAADYVPLSINPMQMIYTAQRIEGFVCFPWLSGAKGTFLKSMSEWLKQDKLVVQETFFDGIESWPTAFQSLFTGKNVGKVVVRIR